MGKKERLRKCLNSYIALIDKNENYLSGVQRYISKYISNDAQIIIISPLKKLY